MYEDASERALTGTYLEEFVCVGELGGSYYALGDIVVNEEILSEPASSAWGGASVSAGSQVWGQLSGVVH